MTSHNLKLGRIAVSEDGLVCRTTCHINHFNFVIDDGPKLVWDNYLNRLQVRVMDGEEYLRLFKKTGKESDGFSEVIGVMLLSKEKFVPEYPS